jgi:hypothetical protein
MRTVEERVALAQAAFTRWYAVCFWSWPENTVVTPELLPSVAHALRNYGGRTQWILSEDICPSMTYNERYSPRYAPVVTPTAT